MSTTATAFCATPLGTAHITATPDGLRTLRLRVDAPAHNAPIPESPAGDHLRAACAFLQAYFGGDTAPPALQLDPGGTPFQNDVWNALAAIPFGQTTTYGALAQSLGQPNGAQAVGAAAGQNPLLVVVPCHRLVGANGALTGFAAGVEAKRWLLQHEGALLL